MNLDGGIFFIKLKSLMLMIRIRDEDRRWVREVNDPMVESLVFEVF